VLQARVVDEVLVDLIGDDQDVVPRAPTRASVSDEFRARRGPIRHDDDDHEGVECVGTGG
jgi:hypothetical protein